MYLSNSEGLNDAHSDDITQTKQESHSPATSNPPSSSSSSLPPMLIVDESSISNDSSSNAAHISTRMTASSNEPMMLERETTTSTSTASPPMTTTTTTEPPTVDDCSKDTSARQRRRNSSIAKLLGGQPLKNQQYEEINQQIIDNQSVQNTTTNIDNSTDSPIPRSRSSITRHLLMNADRHMQNQPPIPINDRAVSPSFSKGVEFFIRRELEFEHAPSTLHRNSSTPSVFQSLNSARNTPPASSPTPSQSKLKRKRNPPKSMYTTPPTTGPPTGKSANPVPFTIGDPYDVDSPPPASHSSSASFPVGATVNTGYYHQNELLRFDAFFRQQSQPQYRLPMPIPTNNPVPFNYHRANESSSMYSLSKKHPDRLPSVPSQCPSTSFPSLPTAASSSFHPYSYPPPLDLALPLPVSSLPSHTSSLTVLSQHSSGTSPRKNKVSHGPAELYESSTQRHHSSLSNPASHSASSSPVPSSPSSGSVANVPLKKRLLYAFESERRPSSSL